MLIYTYWESWFCIVLLNLPTYFGTHVEILLVHVPLVLVNQVASDKFEWSSSLRCSTIVDRYKSVLIVEIRFVSTGCPCGFGKVAVVFAALF